MTLADQHASLATRRDAVGRQLADARERYSATAHSALVNGDRGAQKRALELTREIDAHEAELRAVGAAMEHSEKLAAEERRVDEEQGRRRYLLPRRRGGNIGIGGGGCQVTPEKQGLWAWVGLLRSSASS